jgi:hypothetical protein
VAEWERMLPTEPVLIHAVSQQVYYQNRNSLLENNHIESYYGRDCPIICVHEVRAN